MNNILSRSLGTFIRFLSVILFSIGSIALGGYIAFLTYQTIFNVSVVQIPSVIDMDVDTARQNLYGIGLKMIINNDLIFQQNEQYIVISQKPSAGTSIKKNRLVEVEIRAASSLYQTPDLIGKTISEAEALLLEHGYQIGDIAYSSHQKIPEGSIIAQTPSAGESMDKENKIKILVSKGPN